MLQLQRNYIKLILQTNTDFVIRHINFTIKITLQYDELH